MLKGMAIIPAASAAAGPGEGDLGRKKSSILVAYFSRSGNTRVVAGVVQRALNADLFEIRPTTPYPEDYLETVEKARDERDRGLEPKLAAIVPDIGQYETVYLGFPIWGETAPPLIRSFLRAHNVSGKNLIPLITHGGYGLGTSLSVLANHAPGARLLPRFTMQAPQERQTMATVNRWLKASQIKLQRQKSG
jgi:flavodoxin